MQAKDLFILLIGLIVLDVQAIKYPPWGDLVTGEAPSMKSSLTNRYRKMMVGYC